MQTEVRGARGRLARAEEGAEGEETVLDGADFAVALFEVGVRHVRRALELERRAVRAERVAELLFIVHHTETAEDEGGRAGPEGGARASTTGGLFATPARGGATEASEALHGRRERDAETQALTETTDTAPERAGGEHGGLGDTVQRGGVAQTREEAGAPAGVGAGKRGHERHLSVATGLFVVESGRVRGPLRDVVTARRAGARVGVDEATELTAGVEAVGESGGRGEEGGKNGGRRSERRHRVC